MAKGDLRAKYWVGIVWLRSMVEDWQEQIGDIVQLPFCYCIHDQDKDQADQERGKHAHLILCFPNTTTYSYAMKVYNRLSSPGNKCCNKIEEIVGFRNQYNYLIHDTDAARAAGKHQYSPDERISGNNFDVGLYEQITQADKDEALKEMIALIKEKKLFNMLDFYDVIVDHEKATIYLDVLKSYSGLLQKILDGHYQRLVRANFFKDKEATGL